MKFAKAFDKPLDIKQSFDKTKLNYIIGGVEYNRFDQIQEANVDLNIYEVLEKYNLSKDLETAHKLFQDKDKVKQVMTDITEIQQFAHAGEMKMYMQKCHNMFMALPIEVRKEFENNAEKFMKEGEQWLTQKLAEIDKKPTIIEEPKGETNE